MRFPNLPNTGLFLQRLTGRSFEELFATINYRGLFVMTTSTVAGFVFLQEVFVDYMATPSQKELDLVRGVDTPRVKPDFVTEWENKQNKQ